MPEPLRLIHIVWLSNIGGGELFALDLIRALDRASDRSEGGERVEQQLFYLGPGGPLREAIDGLGIPTTRFEKTTKLGAVALWRLARALRRAAPDVVQLHGEAGIYWGLTAALLARVPKRVALIYEYGANTRAKWAVQRWLLPRADRVLFGSESVLRWTLPRLPRLEGKAFVGPCGIDTAPFRQIAEQRRDPMSGEAAVSERRTARLLTVGRLVEAKGHSVLLEAVRQLADREISVHLKIVGYGELRDALAEQARRLGIAERVEFAGAVRPITPLLADCDLYVFPSLREVQGLAPIEAMAAGVPVVASAVGGLPEMLTDGANALLVPPGDPTALAQAIEKLWGDPALRVRLAASGAQTALDYDIEVVAERFLQHYRELTAGKEPDA